MIINDKASSSVSTHDPGMPEETRLAGAAGRGPDNCPMSRGATVVGGAQSAQILLVFWLSE